MRNFLICLMLMLSPLTALAELSVDELKHACSQFVEQEKAWFENLSTSKEEAFMAGRCEGAIKAIVADSQGCYISSGKLVNAAIRVAESTSSRSVATHIRIALGCERY
ncbi:hypothetical protein [uncultured Endozoicomonas sp.]|uniref:hypothetical protein n=1 Tax=uncultured Endozoicomonas sp. TaxID=432652 RepID=UPI0026078D1B|nr:hypothetical protein [uncultured Endozoicomonas sp.]